MLYLSEYLPWQRGYFDHLLWVALIASDVILNKYGSFQTTLYFIGPDLASAIGSHFVAVRAQLNNALRRLGPRWCLHDPPAPKGRAKPRDIFITDLAWGMGIKLPKRASR